MAGPRSATCFICPRALNSAKTKTTDATSIACGPTWCWDWGPRPARSTASRNSTGGSRRRGPDTTTPAHRAVDKSASDYLQEKVWQPIGAEADATWLLDTEGFELAHFGFNAVLRDYARLGRLLAHDGAWQGKQIIPAQWMMDATTVRASDAYLLPGKAMRTFGYGYLLWLLPGTRRQFALVGDLGQRICVDPASKLVMVQTALETRAEVWRLWSAVVEQLSQR